MKSITKELWFNTKKPREFINITSDVEALLRESGIQEGLMSGSKNSHLTSRFLFIITTPARSTPMPT